MANISKQRDQHKQSRVITLGEITSETVNEIIELIYDVNEEDTKKTLVEPIKLIVNSFGGELYSGLALIDVIELSQTPVYTICHGSAMSMGLIVFAAGHQRSASKYATFMYHEAAYPTEGKIKHHRQELDEVERTDKICDDYLLSKTTFSPEQLAEVRKTRGEWYFSVETALEYGVVDTIL
jgi:ATP-dependent Clp protease protease subunit